MKKVLVVEDVDFNRELVVQLLEDKYHVIEAVNGQEGVELAERERPELILMDLSLPVMDGWEATRRLKANDDLRSIPVIALTSHAMVGDEEKALEPKNLASGNCSQSEIGPSQAKAYPTD